MPSFEIKYTVTFDFDDDRPSVKRSGSESVVGDSAQEVEDLFLSEWEDADESELVDTTDIDISEISNACLDINEVIEEK